MLLQERFEYAINKVLENEGGYINDPDDPGGETNFGITKADLESYASELGLPLDIKDITRIEAEYFYKKVYWEKYNYNAIDSLPIATKIFDMAINMGPSEAHKLAQKSLTYCGYRGTKIDGILGIKTLESINRICLIGLENDFHDELADQSCWYYEYLVEEKPELKKFLDGWLKRAKS